MEKNKTQKIRGQAAIERCCGRSGDARHLASNTACLPSTAHSLKAQAAMEMLVLAGFALAFMLPLAFLFISTTNAELSETSVNQAKISARTIADEAGELYLQGHGAKKTIYVNYPSGVVNGSIEGGLVILSVNANGQRIDAVSSTFANITGRLEGRRLAGIQRIRLVYDSSLACVNITYA